METKRRRRRREELRKQEDRLMVDSDSYSEEETCQEMNRLTHDNMTAIIIMMTRRMT